MARGVGAAEEPVLGVAVVHADPFERGQHPGALHAHPAPAAVAGDQGEHLGGGGVQPVGLRVDAHPGLVGGHHRGGHEAVAQVDQERGQDLLGFPQQAGHPAGRDFHAHQVGQRLGGPVHRQVLVGEQVGPHPRHHRPVDRRGGRLGGELPGSLAPAGTAPGLHNVFGDHDPRLGNVEDLAGLGGDHLGIHQ
jgi:hypothetical protein